MDEKVMRELLVVISDRPHDLTARYELTPFVDIVAWREAESVDEDLVALYKEVLHDLRHGLALAWQMGTLVLAFDGVDEEDTEAAEKAFASLTEAERRITLEDVRAAYQKAAEYAAREAAFSEHMGEFIKAQQHTADENITLGEAQERAEKGTEDVRRIVEGEEEQE